MSPLAKANPVNIPIKPLPKPPMRSSVEGLNQEIEKLVLKDTSFGHYTERDFEKVYLIVITTRLNSYEKSGMKVIHPFSAD